MNTTDERNKRWPVGVSIALPEKNRVGPLWFNRPFIPAEHLFPYWRSAPYLLRDFCGRAEGWRVGFDGSRCDLNLGFPLVQDRLSGEMVPMIDTFPEEDRPLVRYICLTVMWDYQSPELWTMKGLKINAELEHIILARLKEHEQRIVSEGGRTVLAELAFRLGVRP